MDDVIVKRLEELESYQGQGQFLYAGKSLGVTAWGMNILNLPANWPDYPEHEHATDDHEEVYVLLRGHASLVADGRSWPLEPGMVVRVGPKRNRKILPGADGVTILALGGTPGKAYTPSWGRRV
jgi:mannose-6-phosphate isomerase-like protein (cupin superfamily)